MIVTDYSMADLKKHADYCKSMSNDGLVKSELGYVAMDVPAEIVYAYCAKYGVPFKDIMRDKKAQDAFVQHPDNAHFRIWKGKL
jgi:hypothetical protein